MVENSLALIVLALISTSVVAHVQPDGYDCLMRQLALNYTRDVVLNTEDWMQQPRLQAPLLLQER